MLSATYGTLVTPALASKWNEEEDGLCKLCEDKIGTIQHILSGCRVALGQGRYRWRHDKVLKQLTDHVTFHCERRVNTSKNPLKEKSQLIGFVPAGSKKVHEKKHLKRSFGILAGVRDWTVMSDIDGQLKFPEDIASTRLRPDLIIFSRSAKKVLWWELTVPSEERIAESHELKMDRYNSLQAEIQDNGWTCFSFAVEIGARGVVARSVESAARRIGFGGRELKRLVKDSGREAAHCSKWLYLLSRKKEWEYRNPGT